MKSPVTVQFFKNPDIPHWGHEAFVLGEDDWGRWLSIPTGSKRWKGDEEASPTRLPAVFCTPHESWWNLHYGGPDAFRYTMFIDIVTPPVWVSEDRVEMVDLDLDVVVHADGTIEIEDEDEFEVHQVKYGYSAEMIRMAEAETKRVVSMLENRQEPLFEVADSWLRKV